jgi:DNA topoisomerase-1
MSKLLIVESPGKIKKISEYLGNDYIVEASVGHIMDLDPNKMSVDLETFEPTYKVYPDKSNVVDKLRKSVIKVGKDNVYLAADEDREGEMIAWSCAKELKLTKPKRIVFNSITAKELKNAVANPKQIDQNMVKAQQARRILDRFVGYLISPILSKVGLYGAKSAGRVQSVVVKIVVDKEKEVEEFYKEKKDTYFYVVCDVKIGDYEITTKLANKNTSVEVENKDEDKEEDDESEDSDKLEKELDGKKKGAKKAKVNTKNTVSSKSYLTFDKSEEEHVVNIIKAMIKGTYKLLDKKERVRKQNAPPPFTTSTLQQCASTRLGLNAKDTMSIAQKLYENGHITYMRTDSTSISDEAKKLIKDLIEVEYGLEHFEKHDFINKKANTQEAHECIRPNKPQYDQIDGSPNEKRLYNMIWKRTIQSQMKAAEYQSILIEIEVNDKKGVMEKYKLVGTLENLIYEGYLMVDGKKKSQPLDTSKLKNIEWIEINGIEDTQKPPTRYNDASLINKMDPKNLNIGRPSTYASSLERIQDRKYVEVKDLEGKKIEVSKYNVKKSDPKKINVETKDLIIGKEKGKLVPTKLGRDVTEFLQKNFEMIMDYKFTANMEKELDDVAEGSLDNIEVIKKFYDYVKKCMGEIKFVDKPIGTILGSNNEIEIKLMDGPYGKYVSCGTFKINLNKIMIELKIEDESKIDSKKTKKLICDKIIEKMDDPEEPEEPNSKVWNIKNMKYTLKSGQYGHYVESYNTKTNKKMRNYSLKFLINKKAKDNDILLGSDKDYEQVINLITNDDITEVVNYNKDNGDKTQKNNIQKEPEKKVNKSNKFNKANK